MSAKLLLIYLFSLISLSVYAGGDFWLVQVDKVAEFDGKYHVSLTLKEEPRDIVAGCEKFKVEIVHENVPWFSFLPFVYSSHPSAEETSTAMKLLVEKSKNSSDALFGYIGGGLSQLDKEECSFASKGLRVESVGVEGEKAVISYFDTN